MNVIKVNNIRTTRSADTFEPYKGNYTITNKLRAEFINEPLLAVKAIFGFDLPPFQINRLYEAWFKKFYMDCSGYGTGKTFFIALLCALRTILFPNRISGVISHTFGGVKLVFNYFEEWFETVPGFRFQFDVFAKSPVTKSADLWVLQLQNRNSIRGVPPSILGDALRVRSERWNDLYIDEWAHFPRQDVIDTVLYSRATRINKHHDHSVLGNHIGNFSTPGFRNDASYKRAKLFIMKALKEKNPLYGYQRYSYKDLANGFQHLTDMEIINMAKATLPRAIFIRDYEGVWVIATLGFYSYELIRQISTSNFHPELKGKSDDLYIKGIDVARSIKGKGDDFTISIIKLSQKEAFPHKFIHQLILNNLEIDEMAREVHTVDDKFPGPVIMLDPGGGGQFLVGSLSKSELDFPEGKKRVIPICLADSGQADGKNILYFFSRGTLEIKEVLGTMAGDDVLVNNAHSILKNFMENVKVQVPVNNELSLYFTKKLEKQLHIDLNEIEKQYYNIALTMQQLMGVELELDRNTNSPKKTARGQFIFKSKGKKDAAYSFLYAVFGVFLYQEMTRRGSFENNDKIANFVKSNIAIKAGDNEPILIKREVNRYGQKNIFSFKSICRN